MQPLEEASAEVAEPGVAVAVVAEVVAVSLVLRQNLLVPFWVSDPSLAFAAAEVASAEVQALEPTPYDGLEPR